MRYRWLSAYRTLSWIFAVLCLTYGLVAVMLLSMANGLDRFIGLGEGMVSFARAMALPSVLFSLVNAALFAACGYAMGNRKRPAYALLLVHCGVMPPSFLLLMLAGYSALEQSWLEADPSGRVFLQMGEGLRRFFVVAALLCALLCAAQAVCVYRCRDQFAAAPAGQPQEDGERPRFALDLTPGPPEPPYGDKERTEKQEDASHQD